MKVIISENTVVIKSAITLEQFHTVESFNKKALCLREKNDDGSVAETFKVSHNYAPSIGNYGITFNNVDAEKNLSLTVVDDALYNVQDKAKYVQDTYGMALSKLNIVEAQVQEVSDSISGAIAAVAENIEVR